MPQVDDVVQANIKVAPGGVTRLGMGNALIFGGVQSGQSAVQIITVGSMAELQDVMSQGGVGGGPPHPAFEAFFLQADRPPLLKIGMGYGSQTTKEAMSAIDAIDGDWYGLLSGDGGDQVIKDLSGWCALRSQPVLFVANVTDAASKGLGASVAKYVHDAGHDTVLAWHDAAPVVKSLKMTDKLVTGNSADLKVNGSALGATAFATDSNTTLAAIAAKIADKENVASATVTDVVGSGTDDNREIVVTMQKGRYLELTEYQCSGGASVNGAEIATVSGSAEDFAAAWLASRLGFDPGSTTWKFGELKGVTPDKLTSTERAALRYHNVNTYEPFGSTAMPAEGVCASGRYIDVKQTIDWLKVNMAADVFDLLQQRAPKKVPYTQPGYELVAGPMRQRLRIGVQIGALAADPKPVVNVPDRAAATTENKAIRKLAGLTWRAVVTGAVHSVQIDGTLEF